VAKKGHFFSSHSPKDFAEAYKLTLPSFGIDLYRSDPKAQAIPKGARAFGMPPFNYDSGEAFSVTYMYASEGVLPPVDYSFLRLPCPQRRAKGSASAPRRRPRVGAASNYRRRPSLP
jgi:hypothetical protein